MIRYLKRFIFILIIAPIILLKVSITSAENTTISTNDTECTGCLISGISTDDSIVGSLISNQTHSYGFNNTVEGKLVMIFSNNVIPSYFIYEVEDPNSQEISVNQYHSGDILPAGEYVLTVVGEQDRTLDYNISLGGEVDITFNDSSLPTLEISNPNNIFTRLNKGIFTIPYSVSSDAKLLKYSLNRGSFIPITSQFSTNLNLKFGRNYILTEATNNTNRVQDLRTVVSPGVKRILLGTTLHHAAVNVSKEIEEEGFDSDTVLISGTNDIKQAAGVLIAENESAPILTTDLDNLPSVTIEEITRLEAKKAIILGGTDTVSLNVENQLSNLGLSIDRISGSTDYETSTNIAKKVIHEHTQSAIIVSATNLKDAISISSYASAIGSPILYTHKDRLPAVVKEFLNTNTNIKEFTIIGDTSIVSAYVETQLLNLYDAAITRISGSDIYTTGVEIANKLDYATEGTVLINETNAIPAAALAAIKQQHILHTEQSKLPIIIDDYFSGPLIDEEMGIESTREFENIYLIGGPKIISDEILLKLDSYIK